MFLKVLMMSFKFLALCVKWHVVDSSPLSSVESEHCLVFWEVLRPIPAWWGLRSHMAELQMRCSELKFGTSGVLSFAVGSL